MGWKGAITKRPPTEAALLFVGVQISGIIQTEPLGSLCDEFTVSSSLLFKHDFNRGIRFVSRESLEIERMIQVLCNHFHDGGQRAIWGKVAVWNRTLQLQKYNFARNPNFKLGHCEIQLGH
jgi:hypothetical protein